MCREGPRSRLETRLRNVVRYAGRRTSFLQRSEQVIHALDEALSAGVALAINGMIEAKASVLAPDLMAKPAGRGP